jgi:hypothetical protein
VRADRSARVVAAELGLAQAAVYRWSTTRPLLDYYGGQGLLSSVAAAGTIDEVSECILTLRGTSRGVPHLSAVNQLHRGQMELTSPDHTWCYPASWSSP